MGDVSKFPGKESVKVSRRGCVKVPLLDVSKFADIQLLTLSEGLGGYDHHLCIRYGGSVQVISYQNPFLIPRRETSYGAAGFLRPEARCSLLSLANDDDASNWQSCWDTGPM